MRTIFATLLLLSFINIAHAAEDKAHDKTHQSMQEGVGPGHPAETKHQQEKPNKDAGSYRRDNSQRSSWSANPSDRAASGTRAPEKAADRDKNANE